jgi:hypothetical protein
MVKKILKIYGGVVAKISHKYVVERVDVDKNGQFDDEIDGVLIKKYNYNETTKELNFIDQKFVLNTEVKNKLQEFNIHPADIINDPNAKTRNKPDKSVKIYTDDEIANFESGRKKLPPTQYVVVQENTSFTQNVQNGLGYGFGYGVGRESATLVMDSIFGE